MINVFLEAMLVVFLPLPNFPSSRVPLEKKVEHLKVGFKIAY